MSDRYTPVDDRLAAYSAAAAAALLALAPTAAQAQVVYTDVSPDQALATGDEYTIDFDGDGRDDVQIILDAPSATFNRALLFTDETNGGGVVGTGPSGAYNYFYASVLAAGTSISAANVVDNSNVGAAGNRDDFLLASTFGATTYGAFRGVTDAYIGVRFQTTAGTTHYGWIRVDAVDGTALTVKDYAYQSTPNTPINAGMGATATEPDALAEGYRFSPLAPNPTTGRAAFELTVGQPEAVRVEAFDALGRSVAVLHDGPMAAGQTARLALDASALPAGVYSVRVAGESFTTSRLATVIH